MDIATSFTTLDKLPLKAGGEIAAVDWDSLSEKDARRLRELGVDEGCRSRSCTRARSASIRSPAGSAG
jgi:hypothetical protein